MAEEDDHQLAAVKVVFKVAQTEFFRWRGYCVDRFARIEDSAARLLHAVNEHPEFPPAKQVRMFNQRIQHLNSALLSEGPHVKVRKSLAQKLDALGDAVAMRNTLVHAVGDITMDQNGHWVWNYAFSTKGDYEAQAKERLTQAQGEKLEKALARNAHDFGSMAGQLLKQLRV